MYDKLLVTTGFSKATCLFVWMALHKKFNVEQEELLINRLNAPLLGAAMTWTRTCSNRLVRRKRALFQCSHQSEILRASMQTLELASVGTQPFPC